MNCHLRATTQWSVHSPSPCWSLLWCQRWRDSVGTAPGSVAKRCAPRWGAASMPYDAAEACCVRAQTARLTVLRAPHPSLPAKQTQQ
eukprot:3678701-Prymnesium_polylepis.1